MIKFFNIWVVITLAIYYLGPIDWPGSHSAAALLFVLCCLAMFNAGTLIQLRQSRSPAFRIPVPRSPYVAYGLVFAHFALSIIYITEITGKSPLSISSYSSNFGEVYSDYAQQLNDRSAGLISTLVTLTEAILFPFVLMVLFDRFKRDKIIVAIIISTMIASSLLRGTDKELIDVFIVLFAALYYNGLLGRRIWFVAPLAIVILDLFLLRRLGRFSGNLPTCLPDSDACFHYNGFVARTFGQNFEILWVFVSNYIGQGYEGLTRAFALPFDFNFFVGHLPPLKRALCSFSGSLCDIPDYQTKLIAVGWDTTTRWETAYTIIANDFSFWLTPFYLFLLGVVYQTADRTWRSQKDIPSLAALFMILYFFIYSSANMQIAISLEWVMCTIVFLYIGFFRLILGRAN